MSTLEICAPIPMDKLWTLGRAVDAVQSIQPRMSRWKRSPISLFTLSQSTDIDIGFGSTGTAVHRQIMWHVKAALIVLDDRRRRKMVEEGSGGVFGEEVVDWEDRALPVALYLYLKRAMGICVRLLCLLNCFLDRPTNEPPFFRYIVLLHPRRPNPLFLLHRPHRSHGDHKRIF